MREVNWRLASIYKRKNDDNSFNASIHGVKLKGSSNSDVSLNLSEKQEKVLDKALQARMLEHGKK